MKKLLGYINLYSYPSEKNILLHWKGSLHNTKKEALKFKDDVGNIYKIGVVYLEEKV